MIELLGGVTAAARFFEVKPPSVCGWRKKGIPRARLMYLRAVRPDIYAAAQASSRADATSVPCHVSGDSGGVAFSSAREE